MASIGTISKNKLDKPLLNSFETKVFKKNEIIYLKGQKLDKIYIILNGQISSIYEKNKSVKQNIVLKKGSSLGLMDLILNRDYSKSMIAKSSSILAVIYREELSSFLVPESCETILLKSLAIDIDSHNPRVWS